MNMDDNMKYIVLLSRGWKLDESVEVSKEGFCSFVQPVTGRHFTCREAFLVETRYCPPSKR